MGLPRFGWTSSCMIFTPSGGYLSLPPPSPFGFSESPSRPTHSHSLSSPLQGGSVNWRVNPMTCLPSGVGLASVGWDDQCFLWIFKDDLLQSERTTGLS